MEQEKALAILKSGKNVFLTGSAGTGKTYVINQYINYLKKRKVKVAVTASTGIAATHIGGQTIHSWSGIGIKDTLFPKDLESLASNNKFKKAIQDTQVLIIDEISMLHLRQLNLVNSVLRYLNNTAKAFGGKQIILSGDFFQLPPVSKSQEKSAQRFAFMSDAWIDASFTICYLNKQYRQNTAKDNLANILNAIRKNEISYELIETLNNTKHNAIGHTTKLFTHNVNVDKVNNKKLEELSGEPLLFDAQTKGNARILSSFINSILAPKELYLKKNAKVMFVRNNNEKSYLNGTLGTVIDFIGDEEWPLVKTNDGQEIVASPETWNLEDRTGKTIASFTQVPLRLAWAITVHKSQGMTLDEAEIDLSNCFEPGQGYVALSRLKSLKGLCLLGLNDMALQLDALARKADNRFKELSQEADLNYSLNDLEKEFDSFIQKCGGTNNPDEIEYQEKKLKAKQTKASTYHITADYVKEEKSLEEIAKIRELTLGTIINHLSEFKAKNIKVDMSYLKPQKEQMNAVHNAYQQVIKGNDDYKDLDYVPIKPIFDYLEEKVTYDDIKLALLFLEK